MSKPLAPSNKLTRGMSVKKLCRSGGFSQPTFYKWRSRFGGMEPSEAAKFRELEAEKNKHKKHLAEAHLDIHALKRVFPVKR
jgi:putative transposase